MIELQNVTVTVKPDDAVLLDNVSATLDAPTTAIIGENGSGKSTLAKVLSGLLDYTGSAKIHDIEVATEGKQLARRVGMIIANAAAQVIMPSITEDIELSLRHLPKDQRQATLEAVLGRTRSGRIRRPSRPVAVLRATPTPRVGLGVTHPPGCIDRR